MNNGGPSIVGLLGSPPSRMQNDATLESPSGAAHARSELIELSTSGSSATKSRNSGAKSARPMLRTQSTISVFW
jgi:hypothetical protein